MLRYHKAVYIPNEYISKLQEYTDNLNTLQWQYSNHALNNLKYRVLDKKHILLYIKYKILNYNDIFEFYADDNSNIIKAVYRFKYMNGQDIILVIASNKKIITIYLNNSNDLHYTLKKEIYQNA